MHSAHTVSETYFPISHFHLHPPLQLPLVTNLAPGIKLVQAEQELAPEKENSPIGQCKQEVDPLAFENDEFGQDKHCSEPLLFLNRPTLQGPEAQLNALLPLKPAWHLQSDIFADLLSDVDLAGHSKQKVDAE